MQCNTVFHESHFDNMILLLYLVKFLLTKYKLKIKKKHQKLLKTVLIGLQLIYISYNTNDAYIGEIKSKLTGLFGVL